MIRGIYFAVLPEIFGHFPIISLGVEAIDSFTECDCPGATLSCIRDDARDSTNGKCPPCPTSCPTLGSFLFVSNHDMFVLL